MSSDEVREAIAGLREGDEVEIIYRGAVSRVSDGDVALSDDERWCLAPHDVRVIKRAPLPEPPCPFPMGAKVRRPAYSIPAGSVGEVTDWKQDEDGDWYLAVRYPGVTSLVAVDPENVILVPEVPEPPAGTPVWWDGKWWIRDEESAPYAPTLWGERDLTKFWEFMPGAVPAATPGGDDE